MKNRPIKWLWEITGKLKFGVLFLALAQAALGICTVYYALMLKNVIDGAVSGDKNAFMSNLIGFIILIAVQIILRAAERRYSEFSKASIENALKKRVFGDILRKDHASVESIHSAEWLNRLTNDTTVCANGITDIIPGLLGMLVKLVGALIMILTIEPKFAYVLIPGGIVLFLVTYGFRSKLKRMHKNIQEKDGLLRVFMQERIESMPIVRSFAAEDVAEAGAFARMNAHKKARMSRNLFANINQSGFGVAMNGMYIFGLAYGCSGILSGTVTYGTLTAILQLISQIQAPFTSISSYLPRIYAVTASAERLMQAEQLEDDVKEALPTERIQALYADEIVSFGLDNASFAYKTRQPSEDEKAGKAPLVLKGLNAEIEKGSFTAITGHSGCGKSTMLKLFMCLYKLDGGIRYFKDRQGEKHEITSEYRRLFAYVPQGNMLMSGTVRDVVTFASLSQTYNDERIHRALEIACASEFVDKLPDGLDTVLGEKGHGLSEGQMQRIAIARAVFSDDPILLLDEATSALDERTERRLLDNLRSMTDKTVLIVTHRPAALEICDNVIKMAEN